MGHGTNLRAFRDCDAREPFFRLYTLLVAIEIVLKDHAPSHVGGHDLQRLAHAALTNVPAGLSVQITTLSRCLALLACTSLNGKAAPINPTKYPAIRYLRHEADFPGETKPVDIAAALNAARQVVEELKLVGVIL